MITYPSYYLIEDNWYEDLFIPYCQVDFRQCPHDAVNFKPERFVDGL